MDFDRLSILSDKQTYLYSLIATQPVSSVDKNV